MTTLTKRLVVPLLLLYGALPASSLACAVLSKEQAAALHERRVGEYQAAAIAMREQADLVFVGRLARLTWHDETIEPVPGKEQVLRKHEAVFEIFDEIKGKYQKGRALDYAVNRNVVHVGCAPAFMQLPKENGAGELYLVYAKDGTILRTNHIPTDTQVLSGWQEAALLREPQ